MFNWAVGREYLDRTPFKRGSATLIKKLHEDNKRRRRIDEHEEAALLQEAPPHIQAMLIAALDTGMRQGEMLAVRLADVDLVRGLITLRGHTTKSGKSRVVPISTDRLRDVLAWLRVDAEGQQKPDDALVFSNEVGEPLRLFHRTWQTLVLRAHGHTVTWAARLNYQGLSDDSQNAFRKINLRWHDLRHEYASRLVEQGVPLAQVRDLLGHASTTATERYDNQTLENLQLAVRKLERGHTFAGTAFQDSFKIDVAAAHADPPSAALPGEQGRPRGRPTRAGQQGFVPISGAKSRRNAPESRLPARMSRMANEWLGIWDELRNWLVTAA